MKRMALLGSLILFVAPVVCAQEKIEAPVWNVSDKWAYNREGPMEVTGRDARYYAVKFSGGIFSKETSGIALFERSNLNAKYILEGDQRKEYRGFRKKILNFPLTLEKQWKGLYQRDELGKTATGMVAIEYQETFRVIGWEEVEVRAGKFKAIKMEYILESKWRERYVPVPGFESKAWYWYSPEVKNIVKCQYEKGYQEALIQEKGARLDWDLVSYELQK
jgi:hypothetical protein